MVSSSIESIALAPRGYGVPILADLFDLSAATVRHYLKRYNTDDLNKLAPDWGIDRKVKLNWVKERWLDLLTQVPRGVRKICHDVQG